MPRGNKGAGRARGQGSPYNRGRGGGRGRGRGRGRGGFYLPTETDFIVQMYGENTMPAGYHPQGLARRGIGSPPANYNSYSLSPGYSSPRGKGGRGRGSRGHGRGDGPLSKLLYEDRPYLRPIKFVPAVHNRILFQEQEEILKPVVEEVGDEEECHVPTAERVARVFSGVSKPPAFRDVSDDRDESLEEIDFSDLSAFQQKVDMEATSIVQLNRAEQVDVEEKFTGAFFDTVALKEVAIPELQDVIQDNTAESAPADDGATDSMASSITVHETTEVVITEETPLPAEKPTPEVQLTLAESTSTVTEVHSHSTVMEEDIVVLSTALTENAFASSPSQAVDDREPVHTQDEEPSLFFVDTIPSPTLIVVSTSSSSVVPLGATLEDEDDVIVYEGPHPRSGVATPISKPAAPALPSLSFSPSPQKFARRPHPAHSKTKSKLKERRQIAWARKRRGSGSFAALGANVAEAQLYESKDPRQDERRRGDSDVDWGDETDDEVDEVANGVDGMDLDPELKLDVEALKRFASGLDANFKTMDDIDDEERIRKEDEEEDGSSESESENDDEDEESVRRAIEEDETMMLGDSDAGEDLSPNSSFQRRLQRIREGSSSKRAGKCRQVDEETDSSGDDFFRNQTRAEEDDDFIAHMNDELDVNESILSGRERQKKKTVFSAIHNGSFDDDDDEWMPQARRKKDKYKDLPSELQEQWKKDRQKKAECKRERELARLSQAADPSAAKKGGNKGRKAMLAAAALDPTITVIPNRIIDLTTLVQQIKRFIANIAGPQSMSLPPADKKTRKNVHELALAFSLNSVSKGKGDARYTTLTKTTMTGIRTNEAAISRIVRRGGNFGGGGEFVNKKGKGKGNNLMPRHKEGDEVGKEAPRIGQSNIGFRMLASMGWSEGDHIGISGGLKDPVTAVMKTSKLGLGATK
ncbi:hypothetical protein EDD18DRAFT_1135523 [Armillaria luteobubalina]|uniref:Protein SQS1 n=1 Tax=Armillaria luteobubalina TaxID=153913 RepID=A0AA39QJA7_9AGAR|nr:hypothetical protein EDD18DRAFT_1135523 [Armillaria luteobubalina]